MNWIISGAYPSWWRVFDDNGNVLAQGYALNQKRARRAIREYMEFASCCR